MGNNFDTGTNGGANFTDLFNGRFVSETRKNQWYQELTSLRQKNDESVDSYANKFKKLADRINLQDAAQKKRMFLMGLNPAYTPHVYARNPADLDAAIDAARLVEIGFNYASGTTNKSQGTTTASSSKAKISKTEVDELTKKLE